MFCAMIALDKRKNIPYKVLGHTGWRKLILISHYNEENTLEGLI